MIEHIHQNIFDVDADVITIPVNCVGVMGAGLALQFKERFPQVYKIYREYCKLGTIAPGRPMYIAESMPSGKYMGYIMFPTKKCWRDPSRLEYIETGLEYIRAESPYLLSDRMPQSIVFPKLGCGCGQLNYSIVKPVMEKYLEGLQHLSNIIICE